MQVIIDRAVANVFSVSLRDMGGERHGLSECQVLAGIGGASDSIVVGSLMRDGPESKDLFRQRAVGAYGKNQQRQEVQQTRVSAIHSGCRGCL
jgi:hypothetical protein